MVQSIYEIVTPHRNPKPFTLVVLAVVIIVKEFMFRKVLKVSDDIDSISVKTDAWHHRSDAMTSAAAFIGIGIALYAGSGYENELMDSAPPAEFELQVRNIALKVPGVIDTDKCLLRKSGFKYFIDLHVVVDAEISVHEGHKIGHQVKDKIITTNPRFADVLVHIEPFQKL
jgi:divalent metal cation (Fe/Co/Zn/Cd) transporter